MNPIAQADLEDLVIDAILDFYKSYLGKGGRRRLAEAVKQQVGSEGEQVEAARTRAEDERQRLAQTIHNLLDNITPGNREFVDRRLEELSEQRRQLETRLEELDRLATSQAEIKAIVDDAMRFLSDLEFMLREGLPQEKLVALRQCVERVHIDKPQGQVTIRMRTVPAANLHGEEMLKLDLHAREPRVQAS